MGEITKLQLIKSPEKRKKQPSKWFLKMKEAYEGTVPPKIPGESTDAWHERVEIGLAARKLIIQAHKRKGHLCCGIDNCHIKGVDIGDYEITVTKKQPKGLTLIK